MNGKPEKFVVRERITGFYHGEPTEDGFKKYYTSGCEAVMYDELMEALTETHGCVSKNEEEAGDIDLSDLAEPDVYGW